MTAHETACEFRFELCHVPSCSFKASVSCLPHHLKAFHHVEDVHSGLLPLLPGLACWRCHGAVFLLTVSRTPTPDGGISGSGFTIQVKTEDDEGCCCGSEFGKDIS